MRRHLSRWFWWQFAALCLCTILAVIAVGTTVYLSRGEGFLTMAARTSLMLSIFSCILVFSIGVFTLFALMRRRT